MTSIDAAFDSACSETRSRAAGRMRLAFLK
jgi:hypothetical protein